MAELPTQLTARSMSGRLTTAGVRALQTTGDDSYLTHCELLFERVLAEEGTRLPSARRYANRLWTPTEGVDVHGEHDRLQASFLAGLRSSHRWRRVPAGCEVHNERTGETTMLWLPGFSSS